MTSREFSMGGYSCEHAFLTTSRRRLSFWKWYFNPKIRSSILEDSQATAYGEKLCGENVC